MHPPSVDRLFRSRFGRRILVGFAAGALVPAVLSAVLIPWLGTDGAIAFALVLGAGSAVLFALGQIRRQLHPLAELEQVTRRIGGGDFETPVRLESGDELAELGEALNSMAERLEGRFYAAEKTAEIDREILSSVDTAAIAQTALDLVPELYPCQGLSLTVPGAHLESAATTWMDLPEGDATTGEQEAGEVWGEADSPRVSEQRATIRRMVPTELSAEDLQHALRNAEGFVFSAGHPVPGYLAHLRRGNANSGTVVACPLLHGGDLVGILAVCADPTRPSEGAMPRLRRVADRIAVALGNSRMVDQVRVLAFYDNLTRLPNRILFLERLGQAIGRARPSGRQVAVCTLDLDHFGRINETLGPGLGDRLIQEVGSRLAEVCRPDQAPTSGWGELKGVQIARLGGDEFAVIMPDLEDAEEAVRLARRISAAVQHPFRLGVQEVFVTASIGIAVHPADGPDSDTVHKNAGLALSHAKKEGRNTIEQYSDSMHAGALGRMQLERELRRAVENGEFTLWYQPIVDLNSRWATGAEALVRWDHPERGLVSPGEFMQLCEESGVIVPMGEWSLRTVCTQARQWSEAGFHGLRISVNLSARQLRERGIVRKIQDILHETGARPTELAIELTESLLMEQGGMVERRLRELAELGISLAIDDFGTGYSSLSYLKHFPVSTLKIDRSFIVDVPGDPDAVAITTAILGLARAMDLEVVAEGVETREQAAFLRSKGCEKGQGYLLGRPAPVQMFTDYLRARQRRRASA